MLGQCVTLQYQNHRPTLVFKYKQGPQVEETTATKKRHHTKHYYPNEKLEKLLIEKPPKTFQEAF